MYPRYNCIESIEEENDKLRITLQYNRFIYIHNQKEKKKEKSLTRGDDT